MPEAAGILGRAAGGTIAYVRMPIEEVRAFNTDFALMFEWFDRTGYDTDIERLVRETGIRPLTLPEWATKAWNPAAQPARPAPNPIPVPR